MTAFLLNGTCKIPVVSLNSPVGYSHVPKIILLDSFCKKHYRLPVHCYFFYFTFCFFRIFFVRSDWLTHILCFFFSSSIRARLFSPIRIGKMTQNLDRNNHVTFFELLSFPLCVLLLLFSAFSTAYTHIV